MLKFSMPTPSKLLDNYIGFAVYRVVICTAFAVMAEQSWQSLCWTVLLFVSGYETAEGIWARLQWVKAERERRK